MRTQWQVRAVEIILQEQGRSVTTFLAWFILWQMRCCLYLRKFMPTSIACRGIIITLMATAWWSCRIHSAKKKIELRVPPKLSKTLHPQLHQCLSKLKRQYWAESNRKYEWKSLVWVKQLKSHWLQISRIAGQVRKIENPETLPQERF